MFSFLFFCSYKVRYGNIRRGSSWTIFQLVISMYCYSSVHIPWILSQVKYIWQRNCHIIQIYFLYTTVALIASSILSAVQTSINKLQQGWRQPPYITTPNILWSIHNYQSYDMSENTAPHTFLNKEFILICA